MKKEKYDISNKRIESDGYIFDSKLEYDVYRLIKPFNRDLSIEVHKPISKINWRVDFTLTAITPTAIRLFNNLTAYHGSSNHVILYLEVKGVKDRNFLNRFQQLYQMGQSKRLVIVSYHPDSIVIENKQSLERYTHPILSFSLFKAILGSQSSY